MKLPSVFAWLVIATVSSVPSFAAPVATVPEAADAVPTLAALCPTRTATVHFDGYVAIGGIAQWLTVHGKRCDQPVVLVVHGGPGNPLTPYADALFGGWQDEFTVVLWDQRGAGRTFARDPAAADTPLGLAQLTSDGIEVATQVAAALGQEKVILLGGSWGSALAVHMAFKQPDAFHAVIAIGLLVDERESLTDSVARLRPLATAAGDARTLAMLETLGPPPWSDPRAFGQLRRVTRRYEALATTPPPAHWWQPAAAYATPADLAAAEAGEEHSYLQFVGLRGDGILSRIDLHALGHAFPLPLTLIQGEHDLVTTDAVARRWYDAVQAPEKTFVRLADTGHDPNEAMLAAELAALRRIAAGLHAEVVAR